MQDDQIKAMLENRERAHLRLMAIQAITEERLADAMALLSQIVVKNPIGPQPGVCRFCGCYEDRPCCVITAGEHPDYAVAVTCSWIDPLRTVCSNRRCVDRWRQLEPEVVAALQTSAEESRIVLP